MPRLNTQRVLLIGDADRQLQSAVAQAFPEATLRHAPDVFDGIAELAQDRYSTVLAAAEPVGRRPEAAVRTLRELTGDGRLVLFGDAGLEPVSRRMLKFGCDDYLVTPVNAAQIQQALTAPPPSPAAPTDHGDPPLRLHTDYDDPRQAKPPLKTEPAPSDPIPMQMADSDRGLSLLSNLPISELLLEALLEHPGEALAYMVGQLNTRLGGFGLQLSYSPAPAAPATPPIARDRGTYSYAIQSPSGPVGSLNIQAPTAQEGIAQELLASLGPLLTKTASIQRRQSRLQKLAFTDDLTGLFNCRYFKHFLSRMLAEARKKYFPVTLFLFDIDNFKSYNDRFGHSVGDDILKQTADLMRRCVRDHDLVARIGGDEFAVVFWEKDGPRLPREAGAASSSRPPSEPQQILARFRRLLETQNYPLLGSSGRGTLTISGGLAVYPYDAQDLQGLIDAADKALMFGAKRSGRNSIALVGGEKTDSSV